MFRSILKKTKKRLRKIYKKYFTIEDSQHSLLPDSIYLKKQFELKMGYKLDLRHPKTYNEKLQWLKLHDRKPIYSTMVDKYAAKQFVANIIGEEFIIPTLGLYENPDEIDFDALPNQFVLKCTHSSGIGSCICTDKSKLDIEEVKEGLRKGLEDDYYLDEREWPYKNVQRRIIAEKFIEDGFGRLTDYKFFCFNGKIDSIMICVDREINDVKYLFYDTSWNRLFYQNYEPGIEFEKPAPEHLLEMINIVKRLSQGLAHIRVDLYNVDGQIFFGELTFFNMGGYDTDISYQTDLKWGRLITLI